MQAPSAAGMKALAARSGAEGWRQSAIHARLLLGTGALPRLYLLAEHTGGSTSRNGPANSRRVLTSPLLRLPMWNMPCHAEHQFYPFIPFHCLAEAHAVPKERLVHLQPGYARFHADFVKGLRG